MEKKGKRKRSVCIMQEKKKKKKKKKKNMLYEQYTICQVEGMKEAFFRVPVAIDDPLAARPAV